jgi:hypothetical protein
MVHARRAKSSLEYDPKSVIVPDGASVGTPPKEDSIIMRKERHYED